MSTMPLSWLEVDIIMIVNSHNKCLDFPSVCFSFFLVSHTFFLGKMFVLLGFFSLKNVFIVIVPLKKKDRYF